MALHEHKCRSCDAPYECGNIDCKAGTVNFGIRKDNCPECQTGRSPLRTRPKLAYNVAVGFNVLPVIALTEVYCPSCNDAGLVENYLPKCGGEHAAPVTVIIAAIIGIIITGFAYAAPV